MAVKFLDNTGLGYFWGKIKAWCSSTFAAIAHTHTSYAVKHSYTTAANQAKAWLRIANANTHQRDTSKPLHVQFLLTAWNPDQPADYYAQWFVDCQIFGRNSGIRIFGTSGAPFSQARVLYENTNADIDTNDRPAIDIYLNYALTTACHVEIQEVYNSGWTFLADGVLAVSTVPTGFENRAVGVYGSGIANAGYCDYAARTRLQRSDITANITLANNDTYRSRVLNCTNAITITVPSLDSDYTWFLIKNFNATSTTNNVTIHPSTTSVKIDDSNADIILKPGEWVIIASKAVNSYSLIGDGRWKSQKADKGTTLSDYGITDAYISSGTITLGSNSITPLTSVPSHNQSSDTITTMTGYSKPNSSSAIATSDSLNDAIGKLEAKVDAVDHSNVVHKTGDETIGGSKSFSSVISGSVNGSAGSLDNSVPSNGMQLYHRAGQLSIGTSDDNTYSGSSNNYKLWSFPTDGTVSNGHVANIQDLRFVWSSDYFSDIFISPNNHYLWHRDVAAGIAYNWRRLVEENISGITAPDWNINIAGNAATATALVDSSNFVMTNTSQTISGHKKFTSYLELTDNILLTAIANRFIYVKWSDVANETSAPSSDRNLQFGVQANNGSFIVRIHQGVQSNGDVRTMLAHDHTSTQCQLVFYSYKGKQEGHLTCNINNKYRLGIPNYVWSAVYAGTASIQTSDKRLKNEITIVSDSILDAWENLEWKQFKFVDSIKEKGIEQARIHTGAIAQDIGNLLKANNLDPNRYGFYCYDSWEEKEARYSDTGELIDKPQEAGDVYSLRYEELLCIEAAYQRRKNKILENRISELETQVQNMLQVLESLKGA